MKKLIISVLVFFLLSLTVKVHANYPNYQGFVNDFAHILSNTYIQQLNNKLELFEKKTTDQIAVVTVNTTQPETIEEYSIHLADKWKPGRKGIDNGIILLFSMQDHQMRIEVGRGLEGNLTDIQAKHILTDIIRPYFKTGNYELGIDKGVNTILSTLDPTFATLSGYPSLNNQMNNITGWDIVLASILILIFILLIAFSPLTPLGGSGIWGIPMIWGVGRTEENNEGDGFGGFGGGGFSGGGSSSSW